MGTYLWEEQPLDNFADLNNNLRLEEPRHLSTSQALYLSADGDVAVGKADNGDLSQPCCVKLPAATVLSSAFQLCRVFSEPGGKTCRDDVGMGPVGNAGLGEGGV